ncbi:hypothetical protein ACFYWP_20030 [Actinacidiphila glaucinigra]|uniref:hypothetical protein n=1 Tax=Actinacidiphila glaucinigra TaxID=235986 RepID=UPI0036B15D6D
MQALVEPARTLRATTNADKAGTEFWSEAYALIDTMADGIKAAGAVRTPAVNAAQASGRRACHDAVARGSDGRGPQQGATEGVP